MGRWRTITAAATAVVLGASLVVTAPTTQAATSPASLSVSADSASVDARTNTLASTRTVTKACQKLGPHKRHQLRRALHGKKLTSLRCSRYRYFLRVAALRARAESAKKVTAKLPTVFGMSANGVDALKEAENKIGVTAGVVGVFSDFEHDFPTWAAQDAASRGAALLISWEPWNWEVKSQTQPNYALDRITAGDYDSYIAAFAADAAATGRPVYIRFAAEMNGDWHVWSTGYNGNEVGDYAAAYRHVVDVARAAGGTNIKWMFNPIVSYPGSTPLRQLYPGDAYVDWVGLDGYNWGSLKWGWQSFTDIFTLGLKEIKAIAPSKPLGIAEIGCVPGSKKAQWVADSMAKAQANGVRMFVWFEHNKEADWRLSSDAKVASTTRNTVRDLGWVTGGNYSRVSAALGS